MAASRRSRRRALCTIAVLPGLLAGVAWPLAAAARGYPAKPIRVVVPYAAGGATDILGRMVSARLQEAWRPSPASRCGQSVLTCETLPPGE